MKTSEIASTGAVTIINSTVKEEEEQATATQPLTKKKKIICRIGDEIVSEAVFNRYDLNKDGIISDTEKAAYENTKGKNSAQTSNSTGNIINTEA